MELNKTLMPLLSVAALLAGPVVAQTDTDLTSGASAYAQPGSQAGREMFNQWQAELQLSIEQQAIIAEILADYGSRLEPLLRSAADTAWSIMNVAPRDPDYSVDTETAAQAAAQTAGAMVRVISEMRSAVHSVLTSEQIDTLDRLIETQRAELRAKMAAKQAEKNSGAAGEP